MKVIGIDIDSTITQTGKKAHEYLKEYAPGYKLVRDLPKDKQDEFLDLYEGKIHETCELKDGVKEAFEYLKKNKYKIIIITARNKTHCKKQKSITKKYFKNHGLNYDKILFNKEYKGASAYKNKCEIFIDDKESNLEDISKYGIECLKIGEKSSKYQSFNDWYEIIEYLKTRKGEQDG